ncbi:MAG: efflux transporter outer membrane subunit [Alphaproteobacteria bacterium]
MPMRTYWLFALLPVLSACTVGPDYVGPPGISSRFVRMGDTAVIATPLVARWWETLDDPILDGIEERALRANPNMAASQARLRQARAMLRIERANAAPNVAAGALAGHGRVPESGSGAAGAMIPALVGTEESSFDLYTAAFDASWEIDLFGGRRRSIEAATATAQAAEATLADAQVSLTAEVAHAYIGLRATQTRIALARRSVELQQQMLDLTRQQFERGVASALDVERLSMQFETANARVAPLVAQAEGYMNALALLCGEQPGALDAMLDPPRPAPLPPAAVAIGDPEAMLRRRPDVRAAERRLAADTARIGVAEAARFPRLSWMGVIGIGGTQPSDLTHLDDFVALGAPTLQWSVLNFGRVQGQIRQRESARDEAEALYDAAVLGALRDTEDALARFRASRATVAILARAKASADRSANLTQQNYQAGKVSRIDALGAERQRIDAEDGLSAATAGLTADYVALQKALGLGWLDQDPRIG